MNKTPLKPTIQFQEKSCVWAKLCNCCQSDDDVKVLHFGWEEWPGDGPGARTSGGSSIGLCHDCRSLAREALDNV